MEVPLPLEFWIALFTGMVAATFVPSIRKSIPWPAEVGLWVGFITACVLGVMSVTDKNARDLSMSGLWGAEQVVNTIFALLFGGVGTWFHEHSLAIASLLVVLAGADVLALMLIRTVRSAAPWTPRVRLGDWMELPMPAPAVAARQTAPRPRVAVNGRLAAATAVLATAALARAAVFSVRLGATMQAQTTRMRRAGSRSRLEAIRDATAHLHFAARAWYEGAGQPAISTVAQKAGGAATWTGRTARRGLQPAALRAGQVIDIRALMGAQSLGWYGPMGTRHVDTLRKERESLRGEIDASEPQRPDSLAS